MIKWTMQIGVINSLEREYLDIIHGKECFSPKDLCNYLGEFFALWSNYNTLLFTAN